MWGGGQDGGFCRARAARPREAPPLPSSPLVRGTQAVSVLSPSLSTRSSVFCRCCTASLGMGVFVRLIRLCGQHVANTPAPHGRCACHCARPAARRPAAYRKAATAAFVEVRPQCVITNSWANMGAGADDAIYLTPRLHVRARHARTRGALVMNFQVRTALLPLVCGLPIPSQAAPPFRCRPLPREHLCARVFCARRATC